MKILIAGHKGMLGTALQCVLRDHFDLFGADLPDYDLSNHRVINKLIEDLNPNVMINAAAYTDVDGCESAAERAMTVNAEIPGLLAEACAKNDIRLIHISTDYVFDGAKAGPYTEEDLPNPISIYGKSKLEGDLRIMQTRGLRYLILRTAWLFGPGGKNFVDAIQKAAASKPMLEVVDDQVGCPTFSMDLAQAIKCAIERNLTGLFNAVSSGQVTWYEFAKEILALKHIDMPVYPISSEKLARPAKRPANSVLDASKLIAMLEWKFPYWKEGLKRYLKECR